MRIMAKKGWDVGNWDSQKRCTLVVVHTLRDCNHPFGVGLRVLQIASFENQGSQTFEDYRDLESERKRQLLL